MKVKNKLLLASLLLTLTIGMASCSSSELGKDPFHPIPLEEFEGGSSPSPTTTPTVVPPQTNTSGEGPTVTTTTPPSPTTTDTPVSGEVGAITELKVDDLGKLSWKKAANAQYYEIIINDSQTPIQTKFNNFDILSVDRLPENGAFKIKVRGRNSEKDGAWSDEVNYSYNGLKIVTPNVSGLEGTVLKWSATTTEFKGINKAHPVVMVGNTKHTIEDGSTSFDLAGITSKTEIAIYYEGDGVYNKDSDKVKLVYSPNAKEKLSFTKPENVYMDGDILHFDEVSGANIYYLKDVYNTVTSISGEEINSLSSDREGHFLIKEIWAGNTDLDIGNSEASTVTYFKDNEGLGTAESPYLISTTSHLRYIEYYEALGEAKYYKLTNDISFKEYNPKDDEDYSNFYNLGSLSGVIDGDNHSIKNIVVYYKDGYSSIFDTINETGCIKNLKFENTKWRTWTNRTNDGIMHEKGGDVAILAYTNKGIIDNVILASGSVTAVKDGAAGLVSINRGTIKNSKLLSGVTISGQNEAGGFAIYNVGLIERCINYANISGSSTIGGIAGRNAGVIAKCGNEGKISADIYGGGIVGYNYNIKDVSGMQFDTIIKECYNKGVVEATAYAGGIAGKNGSDGYNETAKDNYANAGIYASYNLAQVKGLISVGGIAGSNFAYYEGVSDNGFGIVSCYNAGAISYVSDFATNRIYLSVSDCSWAKIDSPDFYVYAWTSDGSGDHAALGDWPGKKMTKTTVGSSEFYYVDMTGVKANQLSGLIFNRVNPTNKNEVFNQTEDLNTISSSDTAIYYVNSEWKSASLVEPSKGAIAGYNNMINNCYAISGNLTVGGAALESQIVTEAQLKANIVQVLNSKVKTILNIEPFVNKDNSYPILKWEAEE